MPSKAATKSLLARDFLSAFDLDIRHMPSKKLHILDYPNGKEAFEQFKFSFEHLAREQHIVDVNVTPRIEDEPAATLVFFFLADPKDLATIVSHLTTYTSSERPIIWVLVKEKFHPRTSEKIPSIWEPLTNAQYYEVRPTIKIGNEKWIGTRFTVGGGGVIEDKGTDSTVQMAFELTPQAQQRRASIG